MEDEAEKRKLCRQHRLAMYLSTIFLAGSLFFFFWSAFVPPRDSACVDKTVAFTPLRKSIRYSWTNFGDYFYPRSDYRGPSTPRLEQAWQGLIHSEQQHLCIAVELLTEVDYQINVPYNSIKRLNQSAQTQWMRHKDGGVAANVAGFYQLSCLVRPSIPFSSIALI